MRQLLVPTALLPTAGGDTGAEPSGSVFGWQVTDCRVTLIHTGYFPRQSRPRPVRQVDDQLAATMTMLAEVRAIPYETTPQGASFVLEGDVPSAQVHALTRLLPGVTAGWQLGHGESFFANNCTNSRGAFVYPSCVNGQPAHIGDPIRLANSVHHSLTYSKTVGGYCDDEVMTGDQHDDCCAAREAVTDARREAAAAMARLAEAAVRYADVRIAEEAVDAPGSDLPQPHRPKPGEFVADELSVMLRDQPYAVRCLLARSRRLAADLPTVWEAFQQGDLDAEQVRVIDRVARRVTEAATLAAIDEQAVDAALTRTPKQLNVWLLRLVVRCEPLAFEQRHRRALAERRVTVVQGVDGMGYVTGEVSAADAAAIDGMLAVTARSLGAADPRTEQQRRSDLFADLLLGRLAIEEPEPDDNDKGSAESDWLEVESIDPDTGELIGTQLQPVDADGEPIAEPVDAITHRSLGKPPKIVRRPQKLRIGVVVPLSSLLGASDAPAELADRSGFLPGELLREQIAEAIDPDVGHEVLFTRLLTDDGGRLLDTTELGRYPSTRLAQAIKIRAGTCRFPTCTVPADRCDLDHHEPVPCGATSAANMDPFCRRHHRGKTFAWLACIRDDYGVDWTMPDAERYRCVDQPLPTGWAA